jgi:hypothetical protein
MRSALLNGSKHPGLRLAQRHCFTLQLSVDNKTKQHAQTMAPLKTPVRPRCRHCCLIEVSVSQNTAPSIFASLTLLRRGDSCHVAYLRAACWWQE